MARTGAGGATGDQDMDEAAVDEDVAAVDEAMASGAVDVVPAPPTNVDKAVAAEPNIA